LLRFADRAIGRFPVSLPPTPGLLHFAPVRHEDHFSPHVFAGASVCGSAAALRFAPLPPLADTQTEAKWSHPLAMIN
jgi:hypothetical protein